MVAWYIEWDSFSLKVSVNRPFVIAMFPSGEFSLSLSRFKCLRRDHRSTGGLSYKPQESQGLDAVPVFQMVGPYSRPSRTVVGQYILGPHGTRIPFLKENKPRYFFLFFDDGIVKRKIFFSVVVLRFTARLVFLRGYSSSSSLCGFRI